MTSCSIVSICSNLLMLSMHYHDVTMSALAPGITGISIVCTTVHSGAYQRKNQSSASLAFVGRIRRSPVVSLRKDRVTHKGSVMRICLFFLLLDRELLNKQPRWRWFATQRQSCDNVMRKWLVVVTYGASTTQWPAVKTHLSLISFPPQKCRPSFCNEAWQGQAPT